MKSNPLVNSSIIFIALVFLVIVLQQLAVFLRPLAIAFILMFLLLPLLRWSKKQNVPFGLALAGLTLVALILVAGIIFIVAQSADLRSGPLSDTNVRQNILTIRSQLSSWGLIPEAAEGEILQPEQVTSIVRSVATTVASTASATISELFLALLFLVFLIPSHERLLRMINKQVHKEKMRNLNKALLEIEQSMRDYLMTKTWMSLGTAGVTGIILWLFGTPFILLLSLATFLLNFIPNIGSVMAVLLALGVHALTTGLSWQLVVLGILLLIAQNFFGSYLEPRVAGSKLQLSPIVILIALFFWYWVWGIVGMLLAVPLTAIIKKALARIDATKNAADFMS